MLKLKKHYQEIIIDIKTYKYTIIILTLLFWLGLILINSYPLVAMVLMMPIILYLVGVAPFHTGFVDLISKTILPVSGLCASVNTIGGLLIFHILMRDVFANQREIATSLLEVLGITSLFIGAIYAATQTNLRKLLAYSSVFHVGMVLLVLSSFSTEALFSSLVYLIIYSISLFGIFCCFFGIKQNGTYQKNICDLHGVAHYNPFVISCFMIFLISLVGFPPIIGFNGRITIINFFISNNNYLFAALVIVAIMILVYAYLNIIKAFYFMPEVQKKYDRVDFGVYLVLFFNMIFMFANIINPTFVTNYIEELINKI